MNSLLDFDKTLFVCINNNWSNPVFDCMLPWISHLCDRPLVWTWIIVLGVCAAWQTAGLMRTIPGNGPSPAIMKAIVFSFLYLALIYVVNTETCQTLKRIIHRPRPFVQQTVVLRVPSADVLPYYHSGSMPSGHACSAFMVAALFAERFRRKRYVFYGLASSVAFSRVYLGVHYPSDVVAGGCVGFIITWLMLLLQRRWGKEAWPTSIAREA